MNHGVFISLTVLGLGYVYSCIVEKQPNVVQYLFRSATAAATSSVGRLNVDEVVEIVEYDGRTVQGITDLYLIHGVDIDHCHYSNTSRRSVQL